MTLSDKKSCNEESNKDVSTPEEKDSVVQPFTASESDGCRSPALGTPEGGPGEALSFEDVLAAKELEGDVLSNACRASIGHINLETIKEGEVLEIQDTLTPPMIGEQPQRSLFTFDLSNKGEGDGEKVDPATFYETRISLLENDSSSVLSIPAELPPPPDGGWGWMVVLSSFLCNMIVDGISYSFSPYLDVYSDYFNAPKGTVAWVPSLLAGVYLSVGPIVSSLSNRFGCRLVCISGGLLAGIAYASTLLAENIIFLMVTQGFIAGFGFGLIYLPAVVTVGYYFESKRALATGIAVCGSGVGTFLFPPIMNALIDQFGWKGANLVVSGIILNCCWLGGLMRPLKVPKMRKKDLMQRLTEEKNGSMYDSNYMDFTLPDGTVEKRPYLQKVMNADPGVHSHLNLSGHSTPRGTSFALPTIQEGTLPSEAKKIPSSKDEEHQNLVASQTSEKKPLIASSGGLQGRSSVPSDDAEAQESEGNQGLNWARQQSMPNLERRFSKLELLKIIPATPESSYTNLRSLHNSQDLRRPSDGKGLSEVDSEAGIRRRRNSKDVEDIELKVMSRQDIFYAGSINRLDEFKRDSSFLSYRESTINIQGMGASKVVLDVIDGVVESSHEEEKTKCCNESLTGTLSQLLDLSLLKNPVFLLIGVANFLGMLGFYTPFVYLPSAAIEEGVDKDSATFLVSIIGITNTIGRVIAGFIADIPKVNALWVNNICITFSALCVFLTPFATTYTEFVCIAVFFGFFVSAFIALTSIILVDQFGLRLLSNTFGVLCVFRGLAGVLGPPVAGSIYDATKSYDVSFWCAGALLFICAFLHCVVPCAQRWCSCYEGPVRYTTNEEYIKKQGTSAGDKDGTTSPDAGEGAGIIFEIKAKNESLSSNEKIAAV